MAPPAQIVATIDSFELARSLCRVEGEVALPCLPRLMEFVAAPEGPLHYQIDGEVDDEGRAGARLHLRGKLSLICQRCNAPLMFDLDRSQHFRFAATKEELNKLPIEDDEVDWVVGSRVMNVNDWIEDEAILSLPLVPRHDHCSMSPQPGAGPEPTAQRNPFAVLSDSRSGSRHNKD